MVEPVDVNTDGAMPLTVRNKVADPLVIKAELKISSTNLSLIAEPETVNEFVIVESAVR